MPASGSACAANVAFGEQYTFQAFHPFPVSQAAKKSSATAVIDAMTVSPVGFIEFYLFITNSK